MAATTIVSPIAGEDLIAIEPELLQQVDPGWRRRLSLFTGRALSDTALDHEQAYRSGRLALLGQSVTPGSVSGLELSLDTTTADPTLTVQSGYGILDNGEDVTLLTTLRTALSTLPVLDANGNVTTPIGGATLNSTAGFLLLQPVVVQLNGSILDTAPTLQIVSGNLEASCDQDPSEYAFQDLEIVDGCRLAFLPWPNSVPMPPLSDGASTWRNRLAYAIYAAEAALPPDTSFPWELLGLPLAVMAFDASAKVLFADRYSVVRQGGLPRTRYAVPLQDGSGNPIQLVQPALAQARVAQLAEQIVQSPGITQLAADFTLLPPAGILPAIAVDFVHKSIPWFPSNWSVQAGPVHNEELETVLQTGIKAAPLDVTANETVELLVPLPDSVYDASILVTEAVDPAFQQAIDQATAARNITLQHRKDIQLAANALLAAEGQPPIDLDAGLTSDEQAARDGAIVYTPVPADAFGTTSPNGSAISTDVQNIIAAAARAPYTITIPNSNPAKVIALFNADDFTDLATNGVQHFIDRINAKLDKADDLVNLAFVTAQTDIYRFRQNVLSATDATRLATSPILANIATGDSADATSQNIGTYLQGLINPSTIASSAIAPSAIAATDAVSDNAAVSAASFTAVSSARTGFATSRSLMALNNQVIGNRAAISQFPVHSPVFIDTPVSRSPVNLGNIGIDTVVTGGVNTVGGINQIGAINQTGEITDTGGFRKIISTVEPPVMSTLPTSMVAASPSLTGLQLAGIASQVRLTGTIPVSDLTATQVAGTTDIQSQQPIVGAQLNIRTLSIAERLKQSPSQESLFYSVGNRLNITSLLLALEITTDDLQFLVDSAPVAGAAPSTTPARVATEAHFVYELRDATLSAPVFSLMTAPHLDDNSDEAGLFSSGVRVLDQHTQLLRAIEARIQQYRDFLANVCAAALSSIQNNLAQAQSALTGLQNDLEQERQNLAFTLALFSDEIQRVDNVNTQRAATLATYVQVVAFTRPRTLATEANVPSRQLIPANIASPVPTCLSQPLVVPPELREIASLVREAPLSWFPAAASLVEKIERPSLLTELIASTQSRATFELQQPLATSSASTSPGIYAPAISAVFNANQSNFRSLQAQRAAIQPAQFASLSWRSQVEILKPVAAIADLLSASFVHAEIANAIAKIVQQLSSVATCLYTRIGLTLPVDRLQWAEFLRGPGLTVQLNSLAVLPGWNSQAYLDRQQMQLLVDWLFQQIDQTNTAAASYISDLVRSAILLASHVPASAVIPGSVSGLTRPIIGTSILLTAASSRVAQGMHVQLYQGNQLAAEAVVDDLDSSNVSATITKIHQPGVTLQDKAVAHFTAQSTQFAALKAFVK